MKTLKLQEYIITCSKAKAKIICKENICELVSFNSFVFMSKLQKNVERKGLAAYFEFIDDVATFNSENPTIALFIKQQLTQSLRLFYEKDGFLLHRKLSIVDIHKGEYSFDKLSIDIKKKISGFIKIQYDSLKSLFNKMELSGNQTFDTRIKWLASKTDLVEMAIALYDGGSVGADNRKLSKNEFMQHMSIITGIDLENYEQIIYKVKNRENRTRFLDRLRNVIENLDSDT